MILQDMGIGGCGLIYGTILPSVWRGWSKIRNSSGKKDENPQAG